MTLTVNNDLKGLTFLALYRRPPHSLAVIRTSVSKLGFPNKQVLPRLWELLGSLEPKKTPGGLVRDGALQPDVVPREDSDIPNHDLHHSSE